MVLNLAMTKRRLSFPTRCDQCRAGPGDVNRTAAQHSTKRGLDTIRSIPPRSRSMPRFQAGSRYAERVGVVVTVVVSMREAKTRSSMRGKAVLVENCGPRIRNLRIRSRCLGRRAGPLDHPLIGTQVVFCPLEVIARPHRATNQELAGAAFAKVVVGFVEFDQRF